MQEIDQIIALALAEDIGAGDHTTLSIVPETARATARLLVKDTGTLAGVAFARQLFPKLDPAVEFQIFIEDGAAVQPGDVAFTLTGSVRALLSGERLALNVMQRMSGVATQTRRVVQAIEGTGCRVLDTRKTTPLIRTLEKWAVQIGGGVNHRFGLFDMILIKDNHIDYAGGVTNALNAAHNYLKTNNLNLPIVVENRTLEEIDQTLAVGGVTRILLDNMTPDKLRHAVAHIARRYPTEASGNITPENCRAYAETGVDFISMGSLTHSVKSLDMSLKIVA